MTPGSHVEATSGGFAAGRDQYFGLTREQVDAIIANFATPRHLLENLALRFGHDNPDAPPADLEAFLKQRAKEWRELMARTPGLPFAVAQEIALAFGTDVALDHPDRIAATLRAKAREYAALKARLTELDNSGDLVVRDLLAAAQGLIETGLFDQADAKLVEAERHADLVRARVRASRADLARVRLDYRRAADLYAEAARTVPAEDVEARWRYEMFRALALYDLGREFGDNAALAEAIALFEGTVLPLAPRGARALDWAMTQMNLGTALRTLGERESGTARLEAAVRAYEAALTVWTRERVPLDWAATQNNLGNALRTLGERESGTARLEDAVRAFEAALTERTRERVPLDWAATRGNMGSALVLLAERTGDCTMARKARALLAEAAGALRAGGHGPGAETFERQLPAAGALVARLCGAGPAAEPP